MADFSEYDKPIIVVDDEESVCLVLCQVLEEEGFEVIAVHSGEEALEVYRQNSFDLAIVDINLPGMNGIELMKKLKDLNGDTEVVIITGNGSLSTAISSIRAGAYDYLMKPFDKIENITVVVKHALEKVILTAENKRLFAELQAQNEKLQKVVKILADLVNRDSLTGIHNHRCFQQEIIKEAARADRHGLKFSLIIFDVDNFKNYNDRNGHPAGDELLKTLAWTVERSLRKTDFFARYGGEEFVVILPETGKDEAVIKAEKIRQIVEMAPFVNQESQPGGNITVSLGVATYPGDAQSIAEMIEQADNAMYRAKKSGRNRLCVQGGD